MSFETWLAFTAAATVILAIPGPTILLVVSYALSHGRRSAMATMAGVALGDLTAMTASLLGLGVLLLIVLPFAVGLLADAGQPQFLDASRPLAPQMIVMEATFLVLAIGNAGVYAVTATAARGMIRRPSVMRAVNRTGGSLLIGAGLLTATWRRATGCLAELQRLRCSVFFPKKAAATTSGSS